MYKTSLNLFGNSFWRHPACCGFLKCQAGIQWGSQTLGASLAGLLPISLPWCASHATSVMSTVNWKYGSWATIYNSAIVSHTLYPKLHLVLIYLGDVLLSHFGSRCLISVSPDSDLTCNPMEDGLKTETCNCLFSLESGLYKKDRKLRTPQVCRSPISIEMQVPKYISKSNINGVWIIHPFGLYTPLLPLLQVIKSFLILKKYSLTCWPSLLSNFHKNFNK